MARRNAGGKRRRQETMRFKKPKIRRKIRTQAQEGSEADDPDVLALGPIVVERKWISELAKFSFKFMTAGAYALGGIQFYMDYSSGRMKFVRGPLWRRIYHYAVVAIVMVFFSHKFWVTISRYSEQEGVDVEWVMCLSLFTIQFVGLCMGLALVVKWELAIEVFNSMEPFIALVEDDAEYSPHDDMASSIQCIICQSIAMMCAQANGVVSLLFPDLPVCLYPLCREAGLLPDLDVPKFVWQLAFFPLELTLGMIAMYTAGLGGLVLVQGAGVQRLYARKLKEVTPSTLQEREKMERRYVYLQLYHRTYTLWWNWSFQYCMLSLGMTVVVAVFVSIKYTDLPWYLYWVFPAAGVSVWYQQCGFVYLAVTAREASEEVLDKLQVVPPERAGQLTSDGRRALLKRSRAFHPLPFSIDGYADLTFSVTLAEWDEILNQLFFLLSL